MLDDIVAHDIAQGIGIPIPATKDSLLPPWTRIASCLRPHPAGLALLITEQTFQKQACVPRNPFLPEHEATQPTTQASLQSTLPASTIFESWLPMDSEIFGKGNCNARAGRLFFESSSRSILLFEHDLFGKPVPTFPDHALARS